MCLEALVIELTTVSALRILCLSIGILGSFLSLTRSVIVSSGLPYSAVVCRRALSGHESHFTHSSLPAPLPTGHENNVGGAC